MKMENLQPEREKNEQHKVRSELQAVIAMEETGATPDMDGAEQGARIFPWITAHAEGFATAWEKVAVAHLDIVEDYQQDPEAIKEQIRNEMERIEKGETLH